MQIQTFGSSRTDTTNATITALNNILNAINTGIFSTLYAETELTVNLILVNVLTPAANKFYLATLKNASAGGQNIRVGTAPAFGAPNVGQLLAPGDTLVLQPIGIAINAIADVAGGLLSVLIYESV